MRRLGIPPGTVRSRHPDHAGLLEGSADLLRELAARWLLEYGEPYPEGLGPPAVAVIA
jgi:hypothetical protein